jgi:hypothetical protein
MNPETVVTISERTDAPILLNDLYTAPASGLYQISLIHQSLTVFGSGGDGFLSTTFYAADELGSRKFAPAVIIELDQPREASGTIVVRLVSGGKIQFSTSILNKVGAVDYQVHAAIIRLN